MVVTTRKNTALCWYVCIHAANHTETMKWIKIFLKQSDIHFIDEITLNLTLKLFPSTEQLQPDVDLLIPTCFVITPSSGCS